MLTKICSRCKTELSLDRFSPAKKNSEGETISYSSWCKECKRKLESERRRNKGIDEKVILKVIPEDMAKECGECRNMLSVEHFSPSFKGSLGVSSYCKACTVLRHSRKPTNERKEKAREATQRYRKKHHERWKAMHRVHQFNRKSKIRATDDGTVTDSFLKELFKKETCCWCGKIMEDSEKAIEHVIELNDGGLHSASNIDIACLSCNSSRKNKRKVIDGF